MPPATSPVASSGERKFAVLMFVDLTGYTDLCRRLDPEEVVATVHPVMSAMRRIVESEGGVVPSVAGDGFMAVFGVPAAVPDVAQRAVRAAAVIRELVAAQNAEARTFRIPDVHIGIAAGEVLVVPSDESSGWSLIGNAVNLASRLCDTAGPDEVLVDSHFGELAGVAGAGAHRRTITVKGVTGPLDAWSLPSGTTDSPLGAVATVFVDRTEALRDLDALAEESASRRTSHVVVVSGEAGIGKSRLVSHWLDLRAHRAVWTWTGSTSSGGGLGALLEQVAAATPSPAAAAAEIDRLLASSSTSSLRADPFPAVSAAGRRLLTEVASGRLLVVVIDDAHRADAALLDFVTGLREQPLDVPLLVLLTWRSDESRPPWPAGVSLSALPDDDAATLLAAALGAEPPAELSSAILSRVAGHPLMAVQSAAYLLENGIVDVVDGRCEVRSPAAVDVLPTSLRLFVSARIDRLPADDKAALQELSTYGESVPRDVMDQLAGAAVKLAVPRLIDRGLLRATADGWQFSHGLVQQVAYASLPRSVRAELHRRQWSVTEPELTGVRMHHALRWAQCVSEGDPVRRNEAVRAALTAVADHAEALFRTQAATSLAAAREAARLVEDTGHLFPVETARLHLLTARCLHELGRFEDALHNSDAARDLLAGSGAQSPLAASALLARGHALSRLRRFQAARQTLDEAMTLAESRGDEIARGHALRLLGDTWRHQSHPEFVSATERAYDVLSAAGDVAGATECACILAYLSSISTTARFERWRAAAAANEPLDERTQLWLARADAEAAAMRSDFAGAMRAGAEAVRLGQLLAATDGIADGLAMTLAAGAASGRLPEALDAYERLRALAVSTGNPRMRLVAAAEGAVALFRAGRWPEAEQELQLAESSAESFGTGEATEVFRARWRIAYDRGRWDEAARWVGREIDAFADGDATLEMLSPRVMQAVTYLQLDEQPGLDYLDRLATECRAGGAPLLADVVDATAERLRREVTQQPPADGSPEPTTEVRGMRADTAAFAAEATGAGVREAWRVAASIWAELGCTIWLARAQARSGERTSAEETLDLIAADAAARDWAFGDATDSQRA